MNIPTRFSLGRDFIWFLDEDGSHPGSVKPRFFDLKMADNLIFLITSLFVNRNISMKKLAKKINKWIILTNTYLNKGDNTLAVVSRPTTKSATIAYSPSAADQRQDSERWISGLFIVEYDIDRGTNAGDVMVNIYNPCYQ